MARRFTLPRHHQPAMPVPARGASCATCRFYTPRGGAYGSCGSWHYAAYYGTSRIPCPPEMFCSDWYEPAPDLPVRRCR